MSTYKITFTPSGPYFFGNDRKFAFADKKNGLYFIRSEKVPSQTTVLGTLRYIMLEKKTFADAKNAVSRIGAESFNIDNEAVQEFGVIKRVSSIFITDGTDIFFPAPLDHIIPKMSEEEANRADDDTVQHESSSTEVCYNPFAKYSCIATDSGKKLYTDEYDCKQGLTNGFMSLSSGNIVDDLFTSDVRVGINRSLAKDAFFKREFFALKQGHSFLVYADIDCDEESRIEIAFMGQNKVPFSIKLEKCTDSIEAVYQRIADKISESRKNVCLPEDIGACSFAYCISDFLTARGDNPLNKDVFSCVQTREFRSFGTNENAFYTSDILHRLIKAGSIFIVPQTTLGNIVRAFTDTQKNAANIGFNQIIII